MNFNWHQPTLSGLLSNRESLPHALLVQSAAGAGVEHFGLSLAQSLLCETSFEARPHYLACGSCNACRWFDAHNHPDFRLIVPEVMAAEFAQDEVESDSETADDGAESGTKKAKSKIIKVEQVRAAMGFLGLSSHRGGRKVIMVFPADLMPPGAANALLKTLEEPPAGCHWILVTASPAKLLPTIRSRCRVVDVPLPSADAVVEFLQTAVEGKKVMDAQTARELLALAGGAPIRAATFAVPEEQALLESLREVLQKGEQLDPVAASGPLEKQPLERVVYWLQTWVHDLMAASFGANPRFHLAHAAWFKRNGQQVDTEALFETHRRLLEAQRHISHPLAPRLLIEQLLISYANSFRTN